MARKTCLPVRTSPDMPVTALKFRSAAGFYALTLAISCGLPGSGRAQGVFDKPNPIMQGLEKSAKDQFAAMDADGNGRVTEQESIAWRQQRFTLIDTNKDKILTEGEYMGFTGREIQERKKQLFTPDPQTGKPITQNEYTAVLGPMMQDQTLDMGWRVGVRKEFRRLDRNLNSRVSFKEWMAPGYWFIAMFDHNNDKEVSEDEFVGSKTFKFPPRNPLVDRNE